MDWIRFRRSNLRVPVGQVVAKTAHRCANSIQSPPEEGGEEGAPVQGEADAPRFPSDPGGPPP